VASPRRIIPARAIGAHASPLFSIGDGEVRTVGSSKWINADNLWVASHGSGALTIEEGGEVSNATGYLGYGSGSQGMITVTGGGSKWTNAEDLYVGYEGTGSLAVIDGGAVDVGRTLWASMGDLSGDGTITVGKGAVLDADLVFDAAHGNQQTLAFGTGGQLHLTIDGTESLGVGYKNAGTLTVAEGAAIDSSIGYLGYHAGSQGTATITGRGSRWTVSSGLRVGCGGSGTLTIEDGGEVSSSYGGILGLGPGSQGTVVITGGGSRWTNASALYVGYDGGSGTLTIEGGGEVSNTAGYLGRQSGSHGTTTVIGPGSRWTNAGELWVGYPGRGGIPSGTGSLTVADGGQVTADSLSIYYQSTVDLSVSGDDMLVLGTASTTGSVTNNGQINLHADAFLPAGTYRPISEYAGRTMTWSGSGSYSGVGGTWDQTAKTFTVMAPTAQDAGAAGPVVDGGRLVITDAISGRRVGVGFGDVPEGATFAAEPLGPAELAGLTGLLTAGEEVLAVWDFQTTLTGIPVLLSFEVDPQASGLAVWHFADETWSPCVPDFLVRSQAGVLSFTVTDFSAYAVTGVPEPATLILLAVGGLAGLGRRRA